MKKCIIFLFSFLLVSSSTFPMLRKVTRLRNPRLKKVLPRLKKQKRNYFNLDTWQLKRKLKKHLVAIKSKRDFTHFKNKKVLSINEQKQLLTELEIEDTLGKARELSKLDMQIARKDIGAVIGFTGATIFNLFMAGLWVGNPIIMLLLCLAFDNKDAGFYMLSDLERRERTRERLALQKKINRCKQEVNNVIAKLEQEEREAS